MKRKYTTKKQISAFCQSLGNDIFEDYPFDENWMAMRHMDKGGHVMAFCYEYYVGEVWVNVKCETDYREYWLKKYPEKIKPAYHMNKRHWLTMILDGSITNEDVETLLKTSYVLTKKGNKKK